MLVELHSPDGTPILVNSDEIGTVSYNTVGSTIYMMRTGKIAVKETFDTVVALLKRCADHI